MQPEELDPQPAGEETLSSAPLHATGAFAGSETVALPASVDDAAASADVVPKLPPPVPERKPFWSYVDLALVIGLLVAAFVVISLLGALVVIAVPKLQADPTPLLVPANLALYIGLLLALKAAFKMRYSRPVFSSLGWKKAGVNLGLMALGGVLLAFAISTIAALIHTPKIPTPFDKLTGSTTEMILFGVMAIAIAPLFEELFFRGFIQPLLVRSLGAIAGVVLTAVLFGSLHLAEYAWAWQYALFISAAGAIFGWLRYRTDSIIPSTVMHGCFNAVSVIALFFGKNI